MFDDKLTLIKRHERDNMKNYNAKCIVSHNPNFEVGKVYKGIYDGVLLKNNDRIYWFYFSCMFEIYKNEEEKEMENFKVICIEEKTRFFKLGKVYQVTNNKISTEVGGVVSYPANYAYGEFELYKEETLKEKYINSNKILIFENKSKDRFIFCGDKFLNSDKMTFSPISYYDDDLKNRVSVSCDIMIIYETKGLVLKNLFQENLLTQIWEREPEKLKLTMKEIEKNYNCPIEIVDSKNTLATMKITIEDIEKIYGQKIEIIN